MDEILSVDSNTDADRLAAETRVVFGRKAQPLLEKGTFPVCRAVIECLQKLSRKSLNVASPLIMLLYVNKCVYSSVSTVYEQLCSQSGSCSVRLDRGDGVG